MASDIFPATTRPAAPEHEGIASVTIERAIARLEAQGHDPHAFAIARRTALVAHGGWAPYRFDAPAEVYSVTKTFTATAISYLVGAEEINLHDPAELHIPGITPSNTARTPITVAHLLAMNTGHTVEQLAKPALGRPYDPQAFFAEIPEHEPGTHFAYNSFASHLLSMIVQHKTGLTTNDFLWPFYEQLGIAKPYWQPEGEYSLGGSGLHVSVHDLINLGAAYLEWPSAPIMVPWWPRVASQIHAPNAHQDPLPDNSGGYGFQMWRSQHGYRADGALGQYCLIVPELDLVIAYQGSTPYPRTQDVLQIWWDEVVVPLKVGPAIQFDDDADMVPLEYSGTAPMRLDAVPPEQPISADQIADGPYHFDPTSRELKLGNFHFNIGGMWRETKLKVGSKTLSTACSGRETTDGNWEGAILVTDAPHRLLWDWDKASGQVSLQWHIAPLGSPRLADLAVGRS